MNEYEIPQVTLDFNTVTREAIQRTGLTDFGDRHFHEPLQVLLTALESEADLNPAGRYGQYLRIVGLLVNRLRIEHYFRQHPEILREQFRRRW